MFKKKPLIQFELYGNIKTFEKSMVDWSCPVKVKCYHMWETNHKDALFLIRDLARIKQKRPRSGYLQITRDAFSFSMKSAKLFEHKIEELAKAEHVSHSNVLSLTTANRTSLVFAVKYPREHPPSLVCAILNFAYKPHFGMRKLLPVFEVDSNYRDEISGEEKVSRFRALKNKLKRKKGNKKQRESEDGGVGKSKSVELLACRSVSIGLNTSNELVGDGKEADKVEGVSKANKDFSVSGNHKTTSKNSKLNRSMSSGSIWSCSVKRRKFIKKFNSDLELYTKVKPVQLDANHKSKSSGDLQSLVFNTC